MYGVPIKFRNYLVPGFGATEPATIQSCWLLAWNIRVVLCFER